MPLPPPPPDPRRVDELIIAMARKEVGAVTKLELEMGGQLRAVATRFTGSAADGDEVAQDALFKAWEAASRFDPGKGSGRAWVFAILRNAARDRLRRRRIRWLVGLDELMDDVPFDAPSSEAEFDAREQLAAVRRALGDLPDRQRMALLLASVGGLETPEIADALGTSRGAVEQLLVRARARLRGLIGRERHE